MYPNLIITLSKISKNESFKPDIRSKANNLLSPLLTILIAHMYMNIFSITGPLSRYLQTSGLDLHKCVQMVKASLNELEKIQRNINNTIQVSDLFIIEMNDEIQKRIDECSEDLEIEKIQSKFEVKRVAKKRKMASYESNDEPIEEEEKKFTIEVYNRVLDTIIENYHLRFSLQNSFTVCGGPE